jgi:hypothetical protein
MCAERKQGEMSFFVSVFLISFCLTLSMANIAQNQDKSQSTWYLVGRVLSESGKPLAGIRLYNNRFFTDENGYYKIELPEFPYNGIAIRFRYPGFLTETKVIINSTIHKLDVVMHPGNNLWVPKSCNLASDTKKRVGWRMKVLVPENAKVEHSDDADTDTVRIFFSSDEGLQSMLLGRGPLWGGSPPIDIFISSQRIVERELAGDKPGFDVGVVDEKGRRWRETGFFDESMSYDNVSEKAAKFFDAIIDSMCWDSNPNSAK